MLSLNHGRVVRVCLRSYGVIEVTTLFLRRDMSVMSGVNVPGELCAVCAGFFLERALHLQAKMLPYAIPAALSPCRLIDCARVLPYMQVQVQLAEVEKSLRACEIQITYRYRERSSLQDSG